MVCRADCTCVLSSIFNRTVVKTRVTFRTTPVVHTSYSHDVVSPIFDTSQFLSVFDNISTHAIFIYNILFSCDPVALYCRQIFDRNQHSTKKQLVLFFILKIYRLFRKSIMLITGYQSL